MNRFEGKVALVTGAASGMGRATCRRLAAEGAAVLAVDVNEKGLQETVELISADGGKIASRVCDVTSRQACQDAVAAAVDTFGQLDVLANVAGIFRMEHSVDVSEQDWNIMLAVNLSGPMFLSQAAIPHLLKTSGSIVNVCSNAGLMGQAYTAAYCASKGGLVQLTRAMAMEFMKQPIRINAVCPGGTDTAMNQHLNLPEGLEWDLIEKYSGKRGYADAADQASAIAYLASDEAKSIHGAVLSVDNGLMAG